MTAYLYKFTENQMISLVIPCIISIIPAVSTGADIGSINTVANYIATFFAYQFLVIIPFGLFYLRSSQLTAGETQSESLAADLMHDNPESSYLPKQEETPAEATTSLLETQDNSSA